jgi:uncharacterized protein YbjT (DUF2867 family)
MKVIIFGATGMVGQGVLRECLLDPGVERVLAVTRTPIGQQDAKVSELIHDDFTSFTAVERELTGYDACFFCLGVSAAGMNEVDYRRVTYDITLAAARTLAKLNPDSTFVYVSGQGTDGTGSSGSMWARVKGETENALLALPLRAYMFRPGYIQPVHGARSRTRLYRLVYAIGTPLFPLIRRLAPNQVTTTDTLGCAMLGVARDGAATRILSTKDINAAAANPAP